MCKVILLITIEIFLNYVFSLLVEFIKFINVILEVFLYIY